jgi:hypothetical protein
VNVAVGVSNSLASCLTVTVMLGMMVGMPVSVAVGVVVSGVVGGVLAGLIPVNLVGVTPDRVGALVGVAFGLAGGVAGSLAGRLGFESLRSAHSLARQVGGVVAGVLTGGLAYGVAVGLALGAAYVVAGNRAFNRTFEVADAIPFIIALVVTVSGVIGWRTHRWRHGIALGLAAGVAFGVVYGIPFGLVRGLPPSVMRSVAYGIAFGVAGSATFSILFALPYVLARRIAGPWAGAIAGALGSVGGAVAFMTLYVEPSPPRWPILVPGLVCMLLGLTRAWWQAILLYPLSAAWNILLYRADERRLGGGPRLLRRHSAFWDEHQWLPLFGLEDHLVLVVERNPVEGQAAMEYLADGRQRWAAQAAQIELDARGLERCEGATAIGHAHRRLAAGELIGPASALLRSFGRLSQDVDAALRQESTYHKRLALSAVEDRLDGLLRELTRSNERYAFRFRPIAAHWRRIIADHGRELAEAIETRQEIDNPYVIGVPLTEQQEIFVGRSDISACIEGLLLDRRRPPLLLYGQRRMGKTSLLNNLGRLLSTSIVPLFVDLQGASRASDHAGLLYNITREITRSASQRRNLALPQPPRSAFEIDPFTRFYEWLDEVEQALEAHGRNMALLTLDEFETLDSTITQGRFNEEDVLGMLRYLIQHRPRFKVMLAGSHTLDEFHRWASYLINAQVVHIGYLNDNEARQLIERPVKGFPLDYESKASQRVLDLTRGHPALVQLLCAEIVNLKNEQAPAIRRLARLADIEAAVPQALQSGSLFFADIERNQVDEAGRALLRFLAAYGEGAVVSREALARPFADELDETLTQLVRRELIEPADAGYRFQVELIRRWLA